MAIIQSGSAAGTALLVDPAHGAARVSVRPQDVLGWYSIGAASGSLTALAANAGIFSFRNLSANPIVVRRIGVGFVTTVPFTTAQMMSFALFAARNFTASDSGGTAIALTGANGKHRTSLGTPTSLDCRIATTVSLGGGTRSLDASALGMNCIEGPGNVAVSRKPLGPEPADNFDASPAVVNGPVHTSHGSFLAELTRWVGVMADHAVSCCWS